MASVTMGVLPARLAVRLQRSIPATLSVVKKDETGALSAFTTASLVFDGGATFVGSVAGSTATFTLSGSDVDALWKLGHPYDTGTAKAVRVRLMDGTAVLAAGVVEWSDGFTPGGTSQTSMVQVSSKGVPGLVVVNHGASTTVARPDSPLVYWVGTARPANALPYDFWFNA